MMKAASRLIDGITEKLGSPIAVLAAIAVVVLWLGGLPHFGVQDQNYQLLINTGTTIVTFIMVFCVQHTQNKDATAMQLKLDELVRSLEGARDDVAGIERDADLLKEEAVRAADRVKGEAVKTADLLKQEAVETAEA
jgi:low affinity Fe/Cu permease